MVCSMYALGLRSPVLYSKLGKNIIAATFRSTMIGSSLVAFKCNAGWLNLMITAVIVVMSPIEVNVMTNGVW